MNVFVTGATGYIGSAVVAELLGAGHAVTGLARSDESAAKLAAMGAQTHRGDLNDLDSLRSGAAAADGTIHLGFIHDFANFAASVETDRLAVEAMAAAVPAGGSLVNTSGTAVLAGGGLATEDTTPDASLPAAARVASERAGLAAADRGVRSSVVRLPPSVCGVADKSGFIPMLINLAREKGASCYVGTGANLWPSVNQLDAAALFRLALEKAPAGRVLHGVGDAGAPMREVAELIAAGLGVPVRSIPDDRAEEHFDWMAMFARLDNPTSSAVTRKLLDWTPTHPALAALLRTGSYFA